MSASPPSEDVSALPVHQLRFMLANPQAHSADQLQAAQLALDTQLAAWRAGNEADVATVDALIRQHRWLDMSVLSHDGHSLTVAGGMDRAYYHQLEITFVEASFYSGPMRDWRTDTDHAVLALPPDELAAELSTRFGIEPDQQLFVLKAEDRQEPIYIAAHHLQWNIDTVFYYPRENLKPGERWASWVTAAAGPAVNPPMFDPSVRR